VQIPLDPKLGWIDGVFLAEAFGGELVIDLEQGAQWIERVDVERGD
jgi:hypothetical protein